MNKPACAGAAPSAKGAWVLTAKGDATCYGGGVRDSLTIWLYDFYGKRVWSSKISCGDAGVKIDPSLVRCFDLLLGECLDMGLCDAGVDGPDLITCTLNLPLLRSLMISSMLKR